MLADSGKIKEGIFVTSGAFFTRVGCFYGD